MARFCKYCGNKLIENSQFCGNCGKPIQDGTELYVHQQPGGNGYGSAPPPPPLGYGQAYGYSPQPGQQGPYGRADPFPVKKGKKTGMILSLSAAALALIAGLGIFIIPKLTGGGGSLSVGGNASGGGTKEASVSSAVDEAFAYGIVECMSDVMTEAETVSSANFNMLINPGVFRIKDKSHYSLSTASFVDLEKPEEHGSLVLENIIDPKTNDCSLLATIVTGEEVGQAGGVFFSGDAMYLKRGDVSLPLIKHIMDKQVAESYGDASAFDRFFRQLLDAEKVRYDEKGWKVRVGEYTDSLISLAGTGAFKQTRETTTLAGEKVDARVIALSLKEEKAHESLKNFCELLWEDDTIKGLLLSSCIDIDDYSAYILKTTGNAMTEEERSVYSKYTGVGKLLSDVNNMAEADISQLIVDFRVSVGDNYRAMEIDGKYGQMDMKFVLRFYKNGHVGLKEIFFQGFNKSSVKSIVETTPSGGNDYQGRMISENRGPNGLLAEYNEINQRATITEDLFASEFDMVYITNDYFGGDVETEETTGSFRIKQEKTSGGTRAEITGIVQGRLEYASDEDDWIIIEYEDDSEDWLDTDDDWYEEDLSEIRNIKIDMVLEQNNGSHTVELPEFIEGSGVVTRDSGELFSEYGTFFIGQSTLKSAPLSQRLLFFFMLTFTFI